MFPETQFKLTRQAAFALMISSAFSANAIAEVARVDFASGQVTATGSDGRSRNLQKGAEINVGDTVNTDQGRAQLRFVDGAYMSLQPKTQFRIDDFQFNGKADGTEKGFFSLVRGALRTVTGVVGRTNQGAYRVTTSTATIGIRGTEYLASVENSLLVSVGGGSIAITNDSGTTIIQQGQSAFVANSSSAPVITFEKPVLPPDGTNQSTEVQPRNEVLAGERTDELAPIPPGSTLKGVGAFAIDGVSSLIVTTGTATLNAANQATVFQSDGNSVVLTKGTARVAESFFDGIVGVGRWTDGNFTANIQGTTSNVTYGPNQGLHYAIGQGPTSPLPTNATATYGLLAATSATARDGSLGLGTFSPGQGQGTAVLAVDFTTGKVGTDFSVLFPSRGYRVTSSGGLQDTSQSQISLVQGGIFAGTQIPTTGTAGSAGPGGVIITPACSTSGACTADVDGFLAGPGAVRAGLGYRIFDGTSGPVIDGAAALTRSSLTPFIPPTMLSGIGSFAGDGDVGLFTRLGSATFQPSGEAIEFHNSAGESLTKGTTTVAESFFDGIVGVGRWTNGTYNATLDGGEGNLFTFSQTVGPNQGLHYAIGTIASPLPTNFFATYSLLAATRATSNNGALGLGTFAPGEGAGKPVLAVDFLTGNVGTDFTVTFPSAGYRVATSGGVRNLDSSEISLNRSGAFAGAFFGSGIPVSGTSGSACVSGDGCSAQVQGFFSGSNAVRAGFGYEIFDDGNSPNTIHGAAVLTQSLLHPIFPLAAGAFSYDRSGNDLTGAEGGRARVNSTNQLVEYHGGTGINSGVINPMMSVANGTATYMESGFDGVIGWGRLTNGTVEVNGGETLTLSANQGLHYVYSDQSSLTLPNEGVATFSLLGATKATSLNRSNTLGLGTFTGSLAVDFVSAKVGADFTVAFAGGGAPVYHAKSNGGLTNLGASQMTFESIGGIFYAGGVSALSTTRDGGSCSSGCSTDVRGFLAGANSTRAGLAYAIRDNDFGDSMHGAAAFIQGASQPATINYAGGHDYVNTPTEGAHSGAFSILGTGGTVTGAALTQVYEYNSSNQRGALTTIGTATPTDIGGNGPVSWTRWVSGTLGGDPASAHVGTVLSGTTSFHSIWGTPTSAADMNTLQSTNATGTYALLGGTSPTFSQVSGSGAVGTLNSGSLLVNFGAGTVNANLNLTVSVPSVSNTFVVSAPNLPIAGSGFSGSGAATAGACSGSCFTNIQGFFSGAMASRAGLAYNIQGVNGSGFVTGTAGFNKTGP